MSLDDFTKKCLDRHVGMFIKGGFGSSEPPGWKVVAWLDVSDAGVEDAGIVWHVECSGCGRLKFVRDGWLYTLHNIVDASLTRPGLPICRCLWQSDEYALTGIWRGMLERCYSMKNQSYLEYGGRGIAVCARWRESFVAFMQDVGPRPGGRSSRDYPLYSLDRIDNDGHYRPGNVRWATSLVQNGNKQRLRIPQSLPCAFGVPCTDCALAPVVCDAQVAPTLVSSAD